MVSDRSDDGRMKVSIVGLGKLGSPMAVVFADKGCEVVGVDLDQSTVAAFGEGRPLSREPGVWELAQASRSRISATTSIAEAVQRTAITFIVVPTPSDPAGLFSDLHVIEVCELIAQAIT